MRHRFPLLFLVIFIIMFFGCKVRERKIYGNWQCADEIVSFRKDKTFLLTNTFRSKVDTLNSTHENENHVPKLTGNWQLNKGIIYLTYSDTSINKERVYCRTFNYHKRLFLGGPYLYRKRNCKDSKPSKPIMYSKK